MDMGERGARTSRGRIMIGPSNRVPGAHAPQIETALALTVPGQADLADPTTPYACGDCVHWVAIKGEGKNMGRCREYSVRMRGQQGKPIETRQQACRAFEIAQKGAA
jgi:hypothetical protein